MASLTPVVPDFEIKKLLSLSSGEDKWVSMTKEQLFDGKRVVVFGLPGAFTPTCSTQQLPGYEELYSQFRDAGIDDIYCVTVNDTFVCKEWTLANNIINVKVIPDGSAEFTIKMGMDVRKDNLGFGIRSWRYAAIVDNGNVIQEFVEEGFQDNMDGDPYEVSAPENVLDNVKAYGWPSKYEGDEGKHIEFDFSETTDVKEKLS
jgi:peroxiredoxin